MYEDIGCISSAIVSGLELLDDSRNRKKSWYLNHARDKRAEAAEDPSSIPEVRNA